MNTLLWLAIFWVVMLVAAYFIARSRRRTTIDSLILTFFLGPIGLFLVAFADTPRAESPRPPE
jgi:heme/copper-type cytochrome/quinol oxidase subunit 2